ncbi:hypothetical protein BV22DRAFT_1064496 [Leucogyrophana mollusca]|uniref:Uncharacterized protein n=1 Tax=Leucogyrophana mollusca TaxID=85980 RepID=A0ACB8BK66_9AGAM|nr:hypothetical protein BV22DRAFT_1064496 [Leucogyrophana mollusca]
MKLTFTSSDVQNADVINDDGLYIYKIDTPFSFFQSLAKPTTISKVSIHEGARVVSPAGEIEWHKWSSSIIRFGGHEMQTSLFIPSRGFTGLTHYFTGHDGRPYKWKLGPDACTLKRDDASEAIVARFHHANHGIMKPKHDAYLEVWPDIIHMVDLVLVTFIYVEKLRRDHNRSRQTHRSQGLGSGLMAANNLNMTM